MIESAIWVVYLPQSVFQESSTLSSIRAFLAKASTATAAGPCDPEIVAVPEKEIPGITGAN